jgi:hypothetical protein
MKFCVSANENERWCHHHNRYHLASEFSINEKTGEYYTKCRAAQAHFKKWYKEQSNAHRKSYNEKNITYNFGLKTATWAAYFDGKYECQYGGEIHPHTNGKEFELVLLEMHHMNGDGNEHKVSLGITNGSRATGTNYYRALRKNGWPNIDVISVCPTHHRILHLLEKQNAYR